MNRVEVYIAEGDANRRLGTLEYDELRGKESLPSSLTVTISFIRPYRFLALTSDSFAASSIRRYPTASASFRMPHPIRGVARSFVAERNVATFARVTIFSACSTLRA